MAFLVSFIFLMFYLVSSAESAGRGDDVFSNDMSRQAEGWVPVAQCRADCLNGFGWNFGMTTTRRCNEMAQSCLACWQDCACMHFQPNPPWPQCSSASMCFAGCRRAHAYAGYAKPEMVDFKKATNPWTLVSSAKLFDNATFLLNNTLVDTSTGQPYSGSLHLVFSISLFDGRDWIQLTQAVTFTTSLSLRDNAPQCEEGCLLRTVVVNSSAIMAEADFSYIVSRVVDMTQNTSVVIADDASLSINLTWPSLRQSLNVSSLGTFQRTWTRIFPDSSLFHPNTSNEETVSFAGNDLTISVFQLDGLVYNVVYDVAIVHNTSTTSTRYQYHFTTPDCLKTDEKGLHCEDIGFSARHRSGKAELQYAALIIGGIVVAFAAGIVLYLMLRRMRNKKGTLSEDQFRDNFSLSTSRLTTDLQRVHFAVRTPSPQTEPLLQPSFAEIVAGISYSNSSCQYLVTEGTFGVHRMAVKRPPGTIKNENELKQRVQGLQMEIDVLTATRQHKGFVRLLGTSMSPYGIAVLTGLEENSWPIDQFLQKFYREPKIFKRGVRGESTLLPGGFGTPGTGFLRALTGMVMLEMAEQVASGLAYLNSRRIIHGALCANNVMCNADFSTKIHGLSNASFLHDTNKKLHYNERYNRWLPLEVLKSRASGVSMKTDVWSFGVFMWEIVTLGATPYPTKEGAHLIQFLESGYRLEQSPLCSNEVHKFILSCWNPLTSGRPSMLDLHQELCSTIARGNGNDLIKLSELEELDRMADAGDSALCAEYIDIINNEELDDDVFLDEPLASYLSSDPRSISLEKLFPSKSPIGSLQRFKNKIGSFRHGNSQSLPRSDDGGSSYSSV